MQVIRACAQKIRLNGKEVGQHAEDTVRVYPRDQAAAIRLSARPKPLALTYHYHSHQVRDPKKRFVHLSEMSSGQLGRWLSDVKSGTTREKLGQLPISAYIWQLLNSPAVNTASEDFSLQVVAPSIPGTSYGTSFGDSNSQYSPKEVVSGSGAPRSVLIGQHDISFSLGTPGYGTAASTHAYLAHTTRSESCAVSFRFMPGGPCRIETRVSTFVLEHSSRSDTRPQVWA